MQVEMHIVEEFYNTLQDTVTRGKEYYNVIMGDWNSKIAPNLKILGLNCVGKFCSSKSTNRNMEFLINFAENNNLKISNSFFRKKKGGKWT